MQRAVLVSVFLALIGNLATNTVQIPDKGKPWVWAVLLLLVIATFVIEGRRHRSDVQAQRGRLTHNQVTGAVHGAVIQAETISGSVTVINRSGPVILDALAKAADQLAVAVGTQWRHEEERRRVHDPFPLPVRWHAVPETVVDHPANICCAPAGTIPEPPDLTDHLDHVVEIYQRIPSGRLVILGRTGSGKTILALRFVLGLLDARTTADPVPVIFSLGSWNPTTTSLRDWLTDQLVRDYPALAEPGPVRASLAAALVNAGRILPVLDGFDEIADGLHRATLEALNATSMPLLLTSRPEEYATAVKTTDVLTAAAGIELDHLTLTDLAGYLPRTTRKTTTSNGDTTTVWHPVLVCLRDHPDSPGATNLTAVLSTPLMVFLARTIYSDTPDHDPAELLDTDRFGTPQVIEDHLLGAFVPAVYQRLPPDQYSAHRRYRHWDPDQVRRWLGYLARHLDRLGTRDLAWWQLSKTIPRSASVLTGGLMFGLASGLLFWLVSGLGTGLALGFTYVFTLILRTAGPAPSYLRIQLRSQAIKKLPRKILLGLASGLGKGLAIGFVIGFLLSFVGKFSVGTVGLFMDKFKFVDNFTFDLGDKVGLMFGLGLESRFEMGFGLQNGLMCGLMFGLGLGLVGGLIGGFAAPIDLSTAASPPKLLATDRKNVISQSLGFGLVGGLVSVLIFGLDAMPAHLLTIGLWGGVLVILVSGLGRNAWGRWLILSRVWLPLTGRLPWAVFAFLDDAHQRGVLRQAGAVYQFRHARLQHHLTHAYQARGSKQSVSSLESEGKTQR